MLERFECWLEKVLDYFSYFTLIAAIVLLVLFLILTFWHKAVKIEIVDAPKNVQFCQHPTVQAIQLAC